MMEGVSTKKFMECCFKMKNIEGAWLRCITMSTHCVSHTNQHKAIIGVPDQS